MIEAIYIARDYGGEQESVNEIEVVAGAGIVGDRYFRADKSPGQNVTLIEIEEIEHFNEKFGACLAPGATRRNIVTRGVRLNELIGKEFSIGEVTFFGVELCEPCASLGATLENKGISKKEIVRGLLHRAGLRVNVLIGGKLFVNVGGEVCILKNAAKETPAL